MKLLFVFGAILLAATHTAAQGTVSDKADTPFKLATITTGGRTRLAMVVNERILDLADANARMTERAKLAKVDLPTEMRALIEQYDRVKPRLYQIANYFNGNAAIGAPFALNAQQIKFQAPIKYPWNIVAAAANFRDHAEGMGA